MFDSINVFNVFDDIDILKPRTDSSNNIRKTCNKNIICDDELVKTKKKTRKSEDIFH